MRTLIAILMMTGAVQAQEAKAPHEELAEAVFSHMAATYMCRDALGGLSHYQAARSIAVGSLAEYIPRSDAVQMVDQMDRRFKDDSRADNPDADTQKCLEVVNDGLFRIDVAKAALAE